MDPVATQSFPGNVLPVSPGHKIRPALDLLAEELGADSVVELIETFLRDTPERLRELHALAGGGDPTSLRRAAHSLKGSAALFGAVELEEAAHRLELEALNPVAHRHAEGAAEIAARFEEIRPILEANHRRLIEPTPLTGP